MTTDARPEPDRLRVIFDVTRVLARSGFSTPTGIDRVDLAYLRALQCAAGFELHLVVFDRLGGRALSGRQAKALIDASSRQWEAFADARNTNAGRRLRRFLESPAGTPAPAAPMREHREISWVHGLSAQAAHALHRPADTLRLRRLTAERAATPTVYVNTSHGHLYRAASARWLDASGLRQVFMVHDLIPIEFPQFNRPREPQRHRARLRAIAARAGHVITNSEVTADALKAYLVAQRLRVPPVTAMHLGVGSPYLASEPDAPATPAVPYFVCIGTLEPRKNHHLLLDAWKQLIREGRDAAPRLVLIGRRGWENQAVFDRLDRDPELAGHVVECAGLGDADVRALLAGSRALLSPSFAEGFGLPVAEALASGIPAIVSSIATHREIGGEFPEYLPATATTEWVSAIRDYAVPGSERRRSRTERLWRYRAPSWDSHFQAVFSILRNVALGHEQGATPR